MKRGYQDSPSSSSGPNKSKRKNNPEGDAQFLKDENSKMVVQKVADHYSARTNQTLEEREASPIIHLKKLNNWIKSVLIQLYTRSGHVILDLACGKGGDLIKWDKARIGYYVGIDIAEGSEASGMNLTLDETLGSANPHYCKVLREKIASRQAAVKAMELERLPWLKPHDVVYQKQPPV